MTSWCVMASQIITLQTRHHLDFFVICHDYVIKWKHFSHYLPFERGIRRPSVNSPHKGQWPRALMFALVCAWTNGGVNSRFAGDLRRHRAHYDVTAMTSFFFQCDNFWWILRWLSCQPCCISVLSQMRVSSVFVTGMGVFNNFADVFTMPCPNFNGSNWTIVESKHEWVITYHGFVWMWLFMHALIKFATYETSSKGIQI